MEVQLMPPQAPPSQETGGQERSGVSSSRSEAPVHAPTTPSLGTDAGTAIVQVGEPPSRSAIPASSNDQARTSTVMSPAPALGRRRHQGRPSRHQGRPSRFFVVMGISDFPLREQRFRSEAKSGKVEESSSSTEISRQTTGKSHSTTGNSRRRTGISRWPSRR